MPEDGFGLTVTPTAPCSAGGASSETVTGSAVRHTQASVAWLPARISATYIRPCGPISTCCEVSAPSVTGTRPATAHVSPSSSVR